MRSDRTARVGLLAGPLAFVLLVLLWRGDRMGVVAGLTVWMAVWWMTEAIPIPATSLLPMAILPLYGGGPFTMEAVSVNYGNWRVFLFFGGFLIAIGMERTGLHRRIALRLVRIIGTSPRRLVLGFMIATAFLSMWISNTATSLMMLPIAAAVLAQMENRPRFAVALMLGIAYAASIGGVGTLIGTPPNISLQGQFRRLFPDGPEITFARWLGLGVPFVLVLLPVAWLLLVRPVRKEAASEVRLERLGAMSKAEVRVAIVFGLTALLWIFRKNIPIGAVTIPGWTRLLPGSEITDGVIALVMGLSLFVLPDGEGGRILDWETASRGMPWGILLLFGGGFALADAIRVSGLSSHVGRQFGFLAGMPPVLLMLGCALGVTFLTEVTSNTATAEVLLPLAAGVSTSAAGHDPRVMMLPVTMAASCAFMLPVATPPNAVVFSSGRVSMRDMMRFGLVLNLISAALIAGIAYVLLPWILGVDYSGGVPAWAGG